MSAAVPRKVLMLTQFLSLGGLERTVFNLATTLKAQGEWEPLVFSFDRMDGTAPEHDMAPAFTTAGIAVISRVKPPGFSPRTVLAVRDALASQGVSVIHTHDLGALIYGVCAKLMSLGRVRLVHTQHSFVHRSWSPAYRHYERLFTRFADAITVVSPDLLPPYAEIGIPPERIRVVTNGVSFPRSGGEGASARKQSRRELLDALDAPAAAALRRFAGDRWILYMARLHATKGQDHAMELWNRLTPETRAKSVLLFVGPGQEPGRLERLRSDVAAATDSARVLYMGATSRPELWLSCADVSLSCSEYEGMPLGPIEAAGAGLPLVLSRIPGHEVLKDRSSQYPLSDPSEGARLVDKTLAELEAGADAGDARRWEDAAEIRSRYTLESMARAYARLYSKP
jgi:glycosyltransferase involved in cell wall biosynthesis